MAGWIDMATTTNPVMAGSNQGAVYGAAPADESARIREYFDLRDALAEPGCPVCARVLRAGLHFQVHKLTEDVKVLELNLAGARGEAKSGEVHAAHLREEIQALREEIGRLKAGMGDSSEPSGNKG